MSIKFGTSGLRGLSVELAGLPSFLYTFAFCRHLRECGASSIGGAVLIGQDLRASSPKIASNCRAAIVAAGFEAVDCGTIPTPALAFYGQKLGAPSIMVTGSHIPADRNGIKFYLPDGEITKQDENEILRWAARLETEEMPKIAEVAVRRNEIESATRLFVDRNVKSLPAGALAGLRIGVYQHSTVAREMLVEILEALGATVTPLGWSEHFIPVDTEAVSEETVALLQEWTADGRFDAIVSADGDADRPLVADETGMPLRGDLLGLMTAKVLGADVVVTPVTSNSGIEKNGDFEVLRTQVGSPFVIAGMERAKAQGKNGIVGFEANGGFLTGSDVSLHSGVFKALPTRDCFLPIC